MPEVRTGRTARLAAQAGVLAAVVAGTVAYAHQATDITLVLDGRPVTVQAEADDVRGLLDDEGILVTPRDLVAPGLDAPLEAGGRVVVRFARPLTVRIDGAPRTYWTTELTVADALASLGIRADGATLSASRSQSLGRAGLDVVLSRPKDVTLVADGRTRDVRTAAPTVADLLREQEVTLGSGDQLSVLPTSPVVDGLVVALTRIERRRVTVTEPLAPATVRRPTATMARSERRTVEKGRAGSRRTIYEVILADGRPTSRTAISTVVVRPAVARVVAVGTGEDDDEPSQEEPVTGLDGLNWAALARCESGGNPRAVNPAGYYGLYQFSRSTWRSVGGRGLPSEASPDEQLHRAKILYKRSGAGPWGCGRHLFD